MTVQERYPYFLKDQRIFFDELITEDWETYKSKEWDFSRCFEVRRLFKNIKPSFVLDIGCGCGFHDRLMAEYSFVQRIDAIDYSEKSIEVAEREYPHPKVTRSVAAFEAFRPSRRYDLVVGFQVIEHLDNLDDYFRICIGFCNRPGYIAVSTVNRLRLPNLVRLLKGKRLFCEDPMHYQEYTIGELKGIGKKFGMLPFDSFAYGPLSQKGLDYRKRIIWGYYVPFIASRIVLIFKIT